MTIGTISKNQLRWIVHHFRIGDDWEFQYYNGENKWSDELDRAFFLNPFQGNPDRLYLLKRSSWNDEIPEMPEPFEI